VKTKMKTKKIIAAISMVVLTISMTGIMPAVAGVLTSAKVTLTSSNPGTDTTLSALEAAGQTTLSVTSATGYKVGDQIRIDGGTAKAETLTISQVNDSDTDTVVVTSSLTTDHASGAAVQKVTTHTFTFTPKDIATPIKYIELDYTYTNVAGVTNNDFITDSGNTIIATEGTHTNVPAGSANFATNSLITYTVTTAVSVSGAMTMVINNVNNPTGVTPLSNSYQVKITLKDAAGNPTDSVVVAYAIVPTDATSNVVVTVSIDPTLTFTVAGVSAGTSLGVGAEAMDAASTATSIPFSTLPVGTAKKIAQKLTVGTSADDGYTVTIEENEDLKKTGSTTIIPDISATNASPAAWTIGTAKGGFGYHTTDVDLGTGTANRFGPATTNLYAALTSSPLEVMYANAPVSSSSEIKYIIYQVQITELQEAGDYTNVVTYICTPIF
jgi:hypothetical protein